MRWLRRLAFRVRALFGRGALDRELREELDFHLEMEARKHRAGGMPPAEARREALRRFGGVDRFRERTREAWGGRVLEETAADVRFAVRQLRRRPAFTVVALATLGLGVGTTAALSGVAQALLLRPLPYEHGERMVAFWQPFGWRAEEWDAVRGMDLEAFDAVAAYALAEGSLQAEGSSTVLVAGLAAPDLFEVLGATPRLGRTFEPADHAPGAEAVAMVAHALWRQELGGDPGVVGRRVTMDGEQVTVVGVMPEGFFFPTPDVRVWRPLEIDPGSPVYRGRGWMVMTARRRPEAPDEAVARDLTRITTLLGERFEYPPEADRTRGASVEPLRSHLLGETHRALLLLVGAGTLLLLTACANVAALLLARTSDRAGELAVRTGMGAGRGRLARQLLTEGAVLGLGGGALGAALAAVFEGVLVGAVPMPGGFDGLVAFSWPVAAGAVGVAALLGLAVALVPLRGVLRGAVAASLAGARPAGGSEAGQRLHRALVAAQVVVAVTLVTGATLLVRSVGRLLDVELGLRPAGVVVADVFTGPRGAEERRAFLGTLVERVTAAPGVEAAGTITRLPLRERGNQGGVWIEDRPDLRDTDAPNAYYRAVTPGTFEALGVRRVRGRGFTEDDRDGAVDVALVSEAFAALAWPGEDPLGKRIAPVGFEGEVWSTVVGVVADVRYEGPTREAPRAVYRPVAQVRPWPTVALVVRAPGRNPEAVLADVRREAAALDPMAAVHRTATMEDVLEASIERPLRLRFFLALFGGLALLLGAVGVYGVASYAVSRRTREYGVRLALGADPRRLVRSVVGRGMLPVAVGVGLGVALSAVAARALAAFLFEVPATDPLSLAVAGSLLLLAGAGAALVPALRAGRVDPVEALRSE